ncbi:MAG: hypothetical protein PF508_17475 [Spirochaeta sp.]|jgi:hypothetical protein|nr:hypothetical protein [Spirochaeta sp.]
MFGFLIKKSFFDLWDNFLPAILINLGFIVIIAIPLVLPSVAVAAGPVVSMVVLAAGILVTFAYLGGVYAIAGDETDYVAPGWKTFFDGVRSYLPVTLVFGGIVIVHAVLLSIAIPVYSALGNMFGLLALAFLFWMSVIWLLSAQYILPVRGRLDKNIGKVLKKSFLLSFDNALFTIGVALGGIFIIAVSLFTAFLFPGIAGLAIWYHTAVKLRVYKYDYLEAHPEERKNPLPWDALLYDDRDRVGTRTLRGMIFPWKD